MLLIPLLFFILLAAALTAILEIQIEGSAGWAKNIPAWRPDPNKWYSKLFRILMSDKELTGYHLAIWTTTLLFFHLPFFLETAWSASLETDLLGGYFLFWMAEDFLWFVFNPAFGIKKFRPEYIPWHKKWLGPLPKSYYIGFVAAFILFAI